jgi:serine/threonine-protein kinase RsbW
MIAENNPRILIDFSAHRIETRLLGRVVTVLAEHLGLSKEISFELELAVVEAANNAIIHSCGDDPLQRLELELSHQSRQLIVILKDHGTGINFLTMTPKPIQDNPTIDDVSVGGLGLSLIHTIMDDVQYSSNNGTNTMTMIKLLPGRDHDSAPAAKP